jgi:hypothetical protein
MSLDPAVAPPPLPDSSPKSKRKNAKPNRKRVAARRRGRARRLDARSKLFAKLNFAKLPDDAVLTIPEWTALNSLSDRQGRRILNDPDGGGPVVTYLTEQRKGVTVRANREWQERRARSR